MENLSEKEQKALLALLSGKTREKAAKQAGISESTLYRFLSNDNFKTVLREERAKLFELGLLELNSLFGKASETLNRCLESGDLTIELRAASIVVSSSMKSAEFDVLGAIERLESLQRKAI